MTFNTERGEQSEFRVNRALAHYRAQVQAAQGRSVRSRITRRAPVGAGLGVTFQSHDAILRLVAIAEDFSIGHFVDVVEPLLPADAVVAALWDAELDRSSDTWPQRLALWERYKNVRFTTFEKSGALSGFIEARNSIAHGFGELTRKQRKKSDSAKGKLLNANIRVQGESLIIEATHVEQCASVVKAFIAWLDVKG